MAKTHFKPFLDFRATTIYRAFILNALVLALITVTSIEFRSRLDDFSRTKNLTEFEKASLTFFGTFLFSFFIFSLVRVLLGFGDGYLAPQPLYQFLY